MERERLNDSNFSKVGKIFGILGVIYFIGFLRRIVISLYQMISFFVTHGMINFKAYLDMYYSVDYLPDTYNYSIGDFLYSNAVKIIPVIACIFFLIYLFKEFGTGKVKSLKLFILFEILIYTIDFIDEILNFIKSYSQESYFSFYDLNYYISSYIFIFAYFVFIILMILLLIFLSDAEKNEKALKITAIISLSFIVASGIYGFYNIFLDLNMGAFDTIFIFLFYKLLPQILYCFSVTPFLFMALYPVNYVYGSDKDNETKEDGPEKILE